MNLDDLEDLAQQYRDASADIEQEVRVCMAASCQSSGAQPVLEALNAICQGNGGEQADHKCRVKSVGCMGLCSAGPMVTVGARDDALHESAIYREVSPDDAADLMASVGTSAGNRHAG